MNHPLTATTVDMFRFQEIPKALESLSQAARLVSLATAWLLCIGIVPTVRLELRQEADKVPESEGSTISIAF